MWDPTCKGHPDRANSELLPCLGDNGGVHTGSGIPNHAFAMLTDGKNFNGHSITGIGPIKAAAVWYRALTTYFTLATDFRAAYDALNLASQDLIGTEILDPRTGLGSGDVFTAADALQVDLALRAVEMDTDGRCGHQLPSMDPTPPVECTPQSIVFEDDFESGVNGWSVENTADPASQTPYDWTQVQDLSVHPLERPGTLWHVEDRDIGDCDASPENARHSLISPPIQLPSDLNLATLSFDHVFHVEPTADGGNLKMSVNGGPWQLVPSEEIYYNTYNKTIQSTSPLTGEKTWSGLLNEWVTSLVAVGNLAQPGDTIKLRFDFGKDGCNPQPGFLGWFVDELMLYDCPNSPDCNGNAIADEIEEELGMSFDCDGNGVPDECDPGGISPDCNGNGVPDVCDLRDQTSLDCNTNNVPDECDVPVRVDSHSMMPMDLRNVSVCPGSIPPTFQNCGGPAPGFEWNDSLSSERIVTQVDVHLGIGVECAAAGTPHEMSLNGFPEGSFPATATPCDCTGVTVDQVSLSVDPSHYNMGGLNGFFLGEVNQCFGFRVASFPVDPPQDGWALVVVSSHHEDDCDANQVPDTCEPDADMDGIIDVCDNCPAAYNPDQGDIDGDGLGDVCDQSGGGGGGIFRLLTTL